MKIKTSFKIIGYGFKIIMWMNIASWLCGLADKKYEPYNF